MSIAGWSFVYSLCRFLDRFVNRFVSRFVGHVFVMFVVLHLFMTSSAHHFRCLMRLHGIRRCLVASWKLVHDFVVLLTMFVFVRSFIHDIRSFLVPQTELARMGLRRFEGS